MDGENIILIIFAGHAFRLFRFLNLLVQKEVSPLGTCWNPHGFKKYFYSQMK